jgi:predicted SprT family Zn-dependent metalloprotease
MKSRELFYAMDSNGVKHHIDKLDKVEAKNSRFFCPHCKAMVVPKMGDQKIWHFAHKGEVCDFLRKRDSVSTKSMSLSDFSKKTIAVDEFKFSKDSHLFECEICHDTTNKINGVKWQDNKYVCKKCFDDM